MISYLVDEYGKKTHAVVPIDEWRRLTAIEKSVDQNFSPFELYSQIHTQTLPTIIEIATVIQYIDSDDFLERLQQMYQYIETASPSDISLLYLLRSNEFLNMVHYDDIRGEELCDYLLKEFYITNNVGERLSTKEADHMKSLFLNLIDGKTFLREFKKSYRVGDPKFKKRIRRDAEMKRLALYDFTKYLELITQNDESQKESTDRMMTVFATKLFPESKEDSALTQASKALRDAKERINGGEWKQYIGKL